MNNPILKQHLEEIISSFFDLFFEFKEDLTGWLIWPPHLLELKNTLKIDDYVCLYDNENYLINHFTKYLAKINNITEEKDIDEEFFNSFTDSILNDGSSSLVEGIIHSLESSEADFNEPFHALSIKHQVQELQIQQLFFAYIIASIFNYFSLMVQGEKLTSIVPKAIRGDDDALIRAIKIDRNILTSHPYFKARFEKAQATGEISLISKISRTISTPHLKGKIKNGELYFLFSILDTFIGLNNFTHSQILDFYLRVCSNERDKDDYDTSTISKHLSSYRRLQS